ncbi:MAG: hypothetical protein KJ064_15380 [Anaerolineae bacterium]|nr:hypothetical protein [Anaerolineae bacterium]
MGCFLKSVLLAILIFLGLGFLTFYINQPVETQLFETFSPELPPNATEVPITSNQLTATAIIQNVTATQDSINATATAEIFGVMQTMTALAQTAVPILPPTWTPTSTTTSTALPTNTPAP